MYHYVRNYDLNFPFLKFLDFNNFKKQLDFFEKEYGFLTYDEWIDFSHNGVMPKIKNKIILTFDDATYDHFQVFKELKKRKLWGIFYIPTMPYAERKILNVHKIHILIASISGGKLLKHLKSIISDDMLDNEKIEEFNQKTYINQDNHDGVAEFKKYLNYFIFDEFIEEILNKLSERFDVNYEFEDFYLNESQIQQLSNNKMIIGSHSHNHKLMRKLDKNKQKREINLSFEYLSSIISLNHKTYCHPYGGMLSYNKNTLKILDEEKVLYSFSVNSKNIEMTDIIDSKQFLPRFDCNEFRFGKAT
tara:strand:+ start:162 stop:1073 length:912 start_codon:yes stop_codon:yes gene_type:complete